MDIYEKLGGYNYLVLCHLEPGKAMEGRNYKVYLLHTRAIKQEVLFTLQNNPYTVTGIVFDGLVMASDVDGLEKRDWDGLLEEGVLKERRWRPVMKYVYTEGWIDPDQPVRSDLPLRPRK